MKFIKTCSRYTNSNFKFLKITLTIGLTITTLSLINFCTVNGKEFERSLSTQHDTVSSSAILNFNKAPSIIDKEDAINIIKAIDKNYDVIITDDNYKVKDKYYYVLHSNLTEKNPIEINKSYSDIFNINGENFFRVHTSYSGKGTYYGYRYCVDKESGELYIEYAENDDIPHTFVKYSEYTKNLRKLTKIFFNNNIPLDSHLDVTINGDIYIVHLFSIFFNEEMGFTETSGWYEFNVVTGNVKNYITGEICF